ncbi:MAG: hypothetical protein JWN17_860 [Frankiales bacterium]|nr:hypothetical protein [Frankiales bacterium]
MDTPPVHDDGSRLTVEVDGAVAGYLLYSREPELLRLAHTVVDPAHEGTGVGSRLVCAALASAREQGLGIVPQCSFVRSYLARHPEDLELVPASLRAEHGLPG